MARTTVAIIGGGPAGSTLGSLIKRYKPEIEVAIYERERFPRDHVGESQLPAICFVLAEMGVWDKVEAANFPIKIGATYRWGATRDLWDFEFIPGEEFLDEPRPAKYVGQRVRTAFQVDRAVYDKILLDHAKELGCKVYEETRVVEILRTGDRVDGLKLANGEVVQAKYYVDASGHTGILRRAMGVEIDEPSSLQNVAFWDYWRNAEWAISIGIGGTRVQVMSLGYGWIWFIPLSPDRTSIGLVLPAKYYKQSGKKPEQLYLEAVHSDERIGPLVRNAIRENKFTTTKDWSFVAKRLCGENWFLVGESAGFADPILAAGLTLAHLGARQLAHIIVAFERGKLDREKLCRYYDETQRLRIGQHIRFADFWYTANGVFTDLMEYTREIAKDAGLELDANQAFQWLGTGGFTHDNVDFATIGGYSLAGVKQITQMFTQTKAEWAIAKNNVFKLNLEGAERDEFITMSDGRIFTQPTYRRGHKVLPYSGTFRIVVDVLKSEHRGEKVLEGIGYMCHAMTQGGRGFTFDEAFDACLQTLEGLIHDGWVDASYNPSWPLLDYTTQEESPGLRWNRDEKLIAMRSKSKAAAGKT